MRKSKRSLVIASRTSRLARAQTQLVAQMFALSDPTLEIEFRWMESEADQKPDMPLAQAGGKGLFVRNIEKLLLEHQADLAVHSFKDLPVAGQPGLTVAAIPPRAGVLDVLLSGAGYPTIAALPPGAKLGTASARRKAQLLHLRPDLNIELLRGNVDTRLRAVMDEKRFDAIVLAQAGLERLQIQVSGMSDLGEQDMVPAAHKGHWPCNVGWMIM
ncbi:MAG: hydroxymethylbilane synthase [Phycisphaerales bacterium]|nr:hydroxymethylbilane synthase [Phycisphaerales bacterium]